MRTLRTILWALIAALAVTATYLFLNQQQAGKLADVTDVKMGGPFELVRHDGSTITEKDLAGRAHAIFFGFTNCPEICPTTLYEAAAWMRELGDQSDKIDFYFFSVDPDRDVPEVLSPYIAAFGERFTGVTGDRREMEKTLKSYRVYSRRVELEDGEYTMDHSAFILLFRDDGSFQGTISYGEAKEVAVEKLRRLIRSS